MRLLSTLLAILVGMAASQMPAPASAEVVFSVAVAPPPLPVYDQPVVPGPDYIWTPGYWAYSDVEADYYWVPGAWTLAPEPGLLWTPGYWGWRDGYYGFYDGYWGPRVGFYGGVAYGFGYTGSGYYGGYWRGGSFFYNRSVCNINTTVIQNVYTKTVIINKTNITNVSYNGGQGGITAKATPAQTAAFREKKSGFTSDQLKHQDLSSKNRDLKASVNQGKPAIAAVSKTGQFTPGSFVAARSAGVSKPAAFTSSANGGGPDKRGKITKDGAGNGKPIRDASADKNKGFDKPKGNDRAKTFRDNDGPSGSRIGDPKRSAAFEKRPGNSPQSFARRDGVKSANAGRPIHFPKGPGPRPNINRRPPPPAPKVVRR